MNEKVTTHKLTIKKLCLIAGIILWIFILINLFWLIFVKLRYDYFCGKVDKVMDGEEIRYEKQIEEHSVGVKKPTYMDFSSFLYVADAEGYVTEIDDSGNIVSNSGLCITLFIWPKLFGGYKYGVDFQDEDIWKQVYIDENGKYIDNDAISSHENEELNKMVQNNKEEIEKKLQIAEKIWKKK